MIRRVIQIALAAFGGMLGYQASHWLNVIGKVSSFPAQPYLFAIFGVLTFYLLSIWIVDFAAVLWRKGELKLLKLPAFDLFAGIVGLIIGLLISVLLYPSLSQLSDSPQFIPMLFTLMMGAIGFRVGYKKKDDFITLLTIYRNGKDFNHDEIAGEHKILDTSVIIDGRIADICKTGFVDGVLVIPEFVLEELQHIADSSDLLKRNRGRRGLDILNKIQKELDIKVLIYEGDFEEISEVDSKLVKLAKVLQGMVVTNDYNLNKVCELQGVPVLNINDLANAVKPVVLPGEEILVQVIKDGKEYGQGVAYLDDGTMIVVEGGREFIGNPLDVLVTSVLQTSAGRMIFAKPKLLERAQ